MISMTNKYGKTVRLSADYHLDTAKAYYYVWCDGTELEFDMFPPAARVYNDLSRLIEDGADITARLKGHIRAARLLGYNVRGKEVA